MEQTAKDALNAPPPPNSTSKDAFNAPPLPDSIIGLRIPSHSGLPAPSALTVPLDPPVGSDPSDPAAPAAPAVSVAAPAERSVAHSGD